jgi:molecular chaperone GrpE
MAAKRDAFPGVIRRLVDFFTGAERLPPDSRDQPPEPDLKPPLVPRDRPVEAARLVRERKALVDACIIVADQSGSEMLREHVTEALEVAGVQAIRADGERFDQERHRAVGRVPTEDASRHGVVASTQLEGYADGDDVIRKPEVLVYRHADR